MSVGGAHQHVSCGWCVVGAQYIFAERKEGRKQGRSDQAQLEKPAEHRNGPIRMDASHRQLAQLYGSGMLMKG